MTSTTANTSVLARLRAGSAALAVALLVSCAGQPTPAPPMQEVAAVCVSKATMIRVDDSFCPDWDDDDDDGDGYFAYFYDVGAYVHPIGYTVSGGHRSKPPGVTIYHAPAKGGTGKVYTVPRAPAPAKPPAAPAKPAPAPAKPAPASGGGIRKFK